MEKELQQWCPEHIATGFVGECCGVSHVTVLRWIKNGHLPAFRLPDGHYRICRDDFVEFLERYNIPVRQGMSRGKNHGGK